MAERLDGFVPGGVGATGKVEQQCVGYASEPTLPQLSSEVLLVEGAGRMGPQTWKRGATQPGRGSRCLIDTTQSRCAAQATAFVMPA